MNRRTLYGFLIFAALGAQAHAAGIVSYSTNAARQDDPSQFDFTYPPGCGLNTLTCSIDAAFVNLSLAPAISLLAYAPASNVGGYPTYGAGGSITWNVDILGGNPGDAVTLDVRFSMYATGGSQTGADLDFQGDPIASVCTDCGDGIPASLSGVAQVTAYVGIPATFEEIVGANGSLGTSSTAYADPFIYIDPTFAANNPGYSLDFGDAGNALASPEPGTVWMLGAAALLIAAGVRGRRACWN